MQKLIMPYEWNLSEMEKERIQATNVGKDIKINEPMTPAVFQADGYYIFAFSSDSTVPKEYFERFAMVETDMERITLEVDAVFRLLGEAPKLLIDPFSDEDGWMP